MVNDFEFKYKPTGKISDRQKRESKFHCHINSKIKNHFEVLSCRIKSQDYGITGLWDYGIMGLQDYGITGLWDYRITGLWDLGLRENAKCWLKTGMSGKKYVS
jgi:hypothetical protein